MTDGHDRKSSVGTSAITTKARAQRRAYSVAFASNIEQSTSTKDALSQPSSSGEEREKGTKSEGTTLSVV